MYKVLIVAALSFGIATGAAAGTTPSETAKPIADSPRSLGYNAIASGNLSAAEHMLGSDELLAANDPARLLNLGYIYMRTGRINDARRLYQLVRDSGDHFMVELADGRLMDSREVAEIALRRLPTTLAQR